MGGFPGVRTTLFAVLSFVARRTLGFSFSFTTPPTQCGNATIQWSDGQPPYTLLLVPVGELNPEIRTIIQQNVPNGNEVSFVLDYPSQSQFVAIMNDARGIGTGGTSLVMTVGNASDSSCLNTQQVSPEFEFFQSPTNISQCGSVNLTWQSTAVDPVGIIAVVPNRQSFLLANVTNDSRGVEWQVDIQAGTEMLFVAGDSSGLGTGGSTDIMTVGEGDSSCLSKSSPTTTIIVGGNSPTMSIGETETINPSSRPTIAGTQNSTHDLVLGIGIAVGVVGALLCAGILYLVFRRRRRTRHLDAYHDIDSGTARPRPLNMPRRAYLGLQEKLSRLFTPSNELRREMYQAEPFTVPSSTPSLGTLASSGILSHPPRVYHPVYHRHSKLETRYDHAEGDRSGMGQNEMPIQQLDYYALIPSAGSSETLAVDEVAAVSPRRFATEPKVAQERPSTGLHLMTQNPRVEDESANGQISSDSGTAVLFD